MSTVRNITIDLGPREVMIDGKVIATVDNIKVEVAEAPEEELDMLKKRAVILLVKPLDFAVKRGG